MNNSAPSPPPSPLSGPRAGQQTDLGPGTSRHPICKGWGVTLAITLGLALYSATMLTPTNPSAPTYPALPAVPTPSPEPALPAGFDLFTPPVSGSIPAPGTPAIAEWTKIGQPGAVLALTGSRLSSYTGTQAGGDTKFHVFGQNASGAISADGTLSLLDGLKAAVILPTTLPTDSEYLIWPINSAGAGTPVAVNATNAWWVGPNAVTRGDTVSVFGRNLTHDTASSSSYVYLQKSGAAGVWATVTAANPYKVDFTVPAGLTDGDYQVWTHNGRGGHYGWSGPMTLTVNDGMPWTAQQFNVKKYGAKGDGVTDDQAAINAAMLAAAQVPWSSVYLPAGTYMVSSGFNPPSRVRWMGDGATKTLLKANAGFIKPAQDDPRRYCLFFSNTVANNITFQDMTIDANGNMNGVLAQPIYMRFDSDLRFINVTVNAKGYLIADFHGSTRVSFENCDLIGATSGVFFGTAKQVFIDSCRVFGTNDANTLLTWWGGDGMSCTNTTAQDYDNTQADGWAQGRFFYGSSQWGSNRDIYVGSNTTRALAVRPGYANQNSGEQVGWENGTRFSGHPTSASASTVTFGSSTFFSDAGLQNSYYDAVVVNGTGLGQHRKIVACSGTTVTVSPAWNVAPDSTSTVLIAGVVAECVVYGNTLQGKSDYDTRVTASSGVQPYGNGYDFIADSNDISQVRNGIYMWGMNETSTTPESITCNYFDYVANNNVHNCTRGIVGLSVAFNGWPVTDPYPGISFLGNTCVDNTVDSTTEDGMAVIPDNAPIGDQLDLTVFDRNTVTNSPVGLDLLTDSRLINTIDFGNTLDAGAVTGNTSTNSFLTSNQLSTLAHPAAVTTADVVSAPTTNAVAATSATSSPSAVTAIPAIATRAAISSHAPQSETTSASIADEVGTHLGAHHPVVLLRGITNGQPVKASLPVLKTHTTTNDTITTSAAWLTASEAGAGTPNEKPRIELSCNPAALTRGVYKGSVSLSTGSQSVTYQVAFIVDGR
jgi:hypothetical protein